MCRGLPRRWSGSTELSLACSSVKCSLYCSTNNASLHSTGNSGGITDILRLWYKVHRQMGKYLHLCDFAMGYICISTCTSSSKAFCRQGSQALKINGKSFSEMDRVA